MDIALTVIYIDVSSRNTADKMCDRKAVIKNADMSEEMQQDAVDCATQALEKFNIEKVVFLTYFSLTNRQLEQHLQKQQHWQVYYEGLRVTLIAISWIAIRE